MSVENIPPNGTLTPSNSQHKIGFSRASSTDSFPNSPLKEAIDVNSLIDVATRYAFCQLTATILKTDFEDEEDPNSRAFCKNVLQQILGFVSFPEKCQKIFAQYLQGKIELPDLATVITLIKEDPVIKKNGANIFLTFLLYQFVATGHYDSRVRVLLRHIATLLAVVWEEFEEVEDSLVEILLKTQFVESEQSIKDREKIARNKKIARYVKIGVAGGVGGILIGLTGGLAAPLVALGASAVIGGAGAAVIGTTAGAAILGTTFGVAGAGLAGWKMQKRVGAIEEFSIEPLTNGHSLNCVLVVSGWISETSTNDQAFIYAWRHLQQSKEQYTLRYESVYLEELGKAMEYLMSAAVAAGIQQTLMQTALAGLISAIAWPVAILSAASVLDNPWNVCCARSAEVGEQLAEVLLSRSHGSRPISLVGYSLGARVIYHCLVAMSKRSDSIGIIEDVVLLGAPVTASATQWTQISNVVGGRIINGYCKTDWLLRFVYRTMSVQFSIAGTSPINIKNRKIVNYNVSHIVKGHMDYAKKLTEILKAVGLKTSPRSLESENSLVSLNSLYEDATEIKGLRLKLSQTKL